MAGSSYLLKLALLGSFGVPPHVWGRFTKCLAGLGCGVANPGNLIPGFVVVHFFNSDYC